MGLMFEIDVCDSFALLIFMTRVQNDNQPMSTIIIAVTCMDIKWNALYIH